MALLTIDKNPTITDTIRFTIATPNPDNCPPVGLGILNTYQVENVTILLSL